MNDRSALPADRWYVLLALTLVYTINIADRFVVSTLIDPIQREFQLSDGQVAMLTGAAMAIFYVSAGIPLGILADRGNRKRMIVASLALWSALTALCGLSRNFLELLVARIFVGIGEAGGTPPSQSLLCDKFPPRQRGLAMSLYAVGAAAGAALGASLGGWINDAHGWRTVLVVFGAMGLPLAAVVALTVREPRRGVLDDAAAPQMERVAVSEALRFVAHCPALIHVLAGAAVVTFWGWGLVWWTPTFLLRSHGMSLSTSGAHLGWMHAAGGSAVTLGTAWVMHLLADRQPRYQAWLVAITTIIGTVPSILAHVLKSDQAVLAMLWIFVPITYLYIGPTLAIAQNLVPASMRSLICAFILFVANVANLVVAPILIGVMSDLIGPHLTDAGASLGVALLCSSFTGFWGAWHFWRAGVLLPSHPADGQGRSLPEARAA
ncbi:MFS transporter [Sphingobium sp. HBC34]|uniref:MFS transporter n=1 Tax=Sphingobium cyanobacteriorum TaxID=3063954 RepID=A0ABT8ZN22_9SPHN|nr:MFS transporter [Sphingobium sp. HBC34]MDO7835582.1 MFS transporter [Sphingobium sp. HBC34]